MMARAYRQTTWTDEETPLNAYEMNNIDVGITEALDMNEIDSTVISLFTADGWVEPEQ